MPSPLGSPCPAVCRICHSSEMSGAYDASCNGEPLISPCRCKGTMGLYHRSCLEHWLMVSNTRKCEICGFAYKTGYKKRPFRELLTDRDGGLERRNLITDIICFLVLTPVTFTCAYLCISAAHSQMTEKNDWGPEAEEFDWVFVICLITLSIVLFLTYGTWLTATILYHRRAFIGWRDTHERICVIDQLSDCESSAINRRSGNSQSKISILLKALKRIFHADRNQNIPARHLAPAVVRISNRNRPNNIILSQPTSNTRGRPVYLDVSYLAEAQNPIISIPSAPSTFMASTPITGSATANITLFNYNVTLDPCSSDFAQRTTIV